MNPSIKLFRRRYLRTLEAMNLHNGQIAVVDFGHSFAVMNVDTILDSKWIHPFMDWLLEPVNERTYTTWVKEWRWFNETLSDNIRYLKLLRRHRFTTNHPQRGLSSPYHYRKLDSVIERLSQVMERMYRQRRLNKLLYKVARGDDVTEFNVTDFYRPLVDWNDGPEPELETEPTFEARPDNLMLVTHPTIN